LVVRQLESLIPIVDTLLSRLTFIFKKVPVIVEELLKTDKEMSSLFKWFSGNQQHFKHLSNHLEEKFFDFVERTSAITKQKTSRTILHHENAHLFRWRNEFGSPNFERWSSIGRCHFRRNEKKELSQTFFVEFTNSSFSHLLKLQFGTNFWLLINSPWNHWNSKILLKITKSKLKKQKIKYHH